MSTLVLLLREIVILDNFNPNDVKLLKFGTHIDNSGPETEGFVTCKRTNPPFTFTETAYETKTLTEHVI